MIVMLIDSGLLIKRFREHLDWAKEIDLISAWATEHSALSLLEERCNKHGLKIRAIVGLWHNITEPEALKRIARVGELRLVGDGRPFHPKIYLFRSQQRIVAWVGSANFTEGGFRLNEEAVLESEDTDSVDSWFTNLWDKCGPLGDKSIEEYESCRRRNPPSDQILAMVRGEKVKTQTLLKQVTDWDSYFVAIQKCDIFWRKDRPVSVLDEQNSWCSTIRDLHELITHSDLTKFNDREKRRVFGRDTECPLLGPILNKPLDTVFGENVKCIQKILNEVADLDDSDFPDRAIDAYMKMHGFEGISTGIATRLLSLARPDRFVLVNDYSQERLAQYSGLPSAAALRDKSNYLKLLKFIYKQRWFHSDRPGDSFEASIWDMRVALLDCFVHTTNRNKVLGRS